MPPRFTDAVAASEFKSLELDTTAASHGFIRPDNQDERPNTVLEGNRGRLAVSQGSGKGDRILVVKLPPLELRNQR